MRLNRPRFYRAWSLAHHRLVMGWDGVARGLGSSNSFPLRSLRVQLRSGDQGTTAQDLGLAKMGAFLDELLRFPLAPTSKGLVKSATLNRRRKAKKLQARRPGGPAKQYVYYNCSYHSAPTLLRLWQFVVERLLRFVRRKQLPLRLISQTGSGFTLEIQELTPFLSGSESLYLQMDYFDWEDVQLHFQGLGFSRTPSTLARYFSAYKFPLMPILVQ